MGIEKMLRMYLLQIWFHLSDPATEDAIYDSYAMRKFTGINFLTESVPDETTLCKFRHLLEEHGLNKLFFEAINRVMVETGHMLQGGTIVDATIINAPSSTKNAEKARDPEMHQTKKGAVCLRQFICACQGWEESLSCLVKGVLRPFTGDPIKICVNDKQ